MRDITVAFDPQSDKPLYEQLTAHIIEEIKTGRLMSGEKLPGVRTLSTHLGISKSTVESAYQILAAEGYVQGRARSGYYVEAYESTLKPRISVPRTVEQAQYTPYAYRFSSAEVDTAEFPYRAWAKLYKDVLGHGSGLLHRGHPQGDIELRQALAEFLHQYRGVSCNASQIVIGAGVDHLLGMLLLLLGSDAVYALEDPGYPSNCRTIQNGGRRSRDVLLDASGLDVAQLSRMGANIAYVTPSHQFPTGITMPIGRRLKLIAWANAAPNRYIIEDDYDSEFRHTTRPIPAMQGMDTHRVIYLGTFNRSIAPSIRVAYMVLPDELLPRLDSSYMHASCPVSRFEQQTLARFITEGHYQRHLRRMAGVYRRRRDALIEAMGKIDGVTLTGHEAGLHCLLTHAHLSERELIDRAKEKDALFKGLSEYARGHDCKENTLVVGFGGISEEEIFAAAGLLREAWCD